MLVGTAASHAIAGSRQSIAVLGLEVVDPSGTPTAQDTQVGKDLTDALRGRAKAGTSQYQLAPGSDKELIDQKLLNNCDTEALPCMSAIGNQLGADVLMYGTIKKDGGNKAYQVSLKFLDVGRKQMMKTTVDLIPVSEANGAALQGWAKKLYAKLTGEASGGTLVVKSNTERGTILVNGEEKGSITSSTGTVSLPEGKYKVIVESDGFRRWEKDVTITNGQTANLSAELEKGEGGTGGGDGGVGPGPGPGPGPGGGGEGGGSRGSATWKAMFVGAVLVAGGGVGIAFYGKGKIDDATTELCRGGGYPNDPSCQPATGPMLDKAGVDHWNSYGDSGRTINAIGIGAAIAGGGFAVVAFYKGFIAKNPGSSEHASRGHRVSRDRFVLTPIVSKDGGGATLRLDW
ncbi:MAG TPA: PEGA domain-containing protein [Kofleriaceae bacterium]|nr:PEGA domain-containing protein [Kofleriaceae bacterium]